MRRRVELEQPRAALRAFANSGKPIAAICHGPWTLAEAGVVSGRRMTSWPSIRTDLRNAVTLPAFCAAIVEQFAQVGARA